jgi:hypothetical protein
MMTRLAAIPPYLIALACLFWVGSLIVCIVCVVDVPQTNAAVFYLMTIDVVLTLAKYVMLIVMVNCFLEFLLGITVCFVRRDSDSREAAKEYYIAGKKAVEEETSVQSKVSAAYLSVTAKMEKVLDMELLRKADAFKSHINCVGSSVQSDVNVDAPTSTGTPVGSEEGFVVNSSEIKRADSVSEEGSSLRSAALTA